MITKHNCSTSDVLTGQPPLSKDQGTEAPPVGGLTAYRYDSAPSSRLAGGRFYYIIVQNNLSNCNLKLDKPSTAA